MDEKKTHDPIEDVSVIDLLLHSDAPNVLKVLPTAEYKIKRLSEAVGQPVVFKLRGLPYGKVNEIRRGRGTDLDTSVDIILAGVVSPDLRDIRLQNKFGGVTPAETVKAMLLPGEIDELAGAIDRLSGYRQSTVELVKND